MEKDLIKFMNNIEIINKDLSKYEDEKGFLFMIGTGQLLCSCEYVELDEAQLKQAIFNEEVDKLDYAKEVIKRKKPKSDITKKEKDLTTIVETDVEVSKVYIVRNQLRITKSFINKDEAIKFVKETNKPIIELISSK